MLIIAIFEHVILLIIMVGLFIDYKLVDKVKDMTKLVNSKVKNKHYNITLNYEIEKTKRKSLMKFISACVLNIIYCTFSLTIINETNINWGIFGGVVTLLIVTYCILSVWVAYSSIKRLERELKDAITQEKNRMILS